jgi:thiosulfate reductase cytochrome b subunit
MSATIPGTSGTADAAPGRRLHPLSVRIMHWVNAVAMVAMISSGWGIYNDEAIFGWLFFPRNLTLGSWAAVHLQWHFTAMWLLVLNGLAYLVYGAVSGRFRERLYPIRPREFAQVVRETLRLHIAHDDITVYNAVQKVLYVVVILAGIVQVATGLAIWKPIQFSGLLELFGDFQGARLAHFLGMAVIVGFLAVHVALALLVPRTLIAMLTGGPRLAERPVRRGDRP